MLLRRLLPLAVACAAGLALLAGCAAAPTPTASASPVATHRGRIFQFHIPGLEPGDPNAVNIARHAGPDAPLLLFLPATGAVPDDYRGFLDAASDAGYSVLGLDYWNIGRSLTRTCGADASCYDKFQQNRFNGSDPSRFSRVDAQNSVLHRLRAALGYLAEHDRHGDWGRFQDGRHIEWSRIVLAGHSQGGGESAYIAHHYRVQGVLMFASPVETFEDVSAQWMERPGKTPVSRMYGLDDVDDMYYARIVASWAKLGMGTVDPSLAERTPTGSHVMLTSLDLGSPRQSHGRVVGDRGPRGPGGTPVLEPSWRWMLDQVREPAGASD